ncbi:MAG TPA: RsmB/NOP family class I SAM-dependent RNA methyltransferase [Dongiaceae bacterium]|jgi:16S rRNA (cytosine967-C5)-methyltransferase|nr:RsmB/NOP family class I SAM-dependent RNA methyltransferase [Dongiaceae bacterium]
MTPGARIQAAIELLEAIHAGTAPADRASAAYFRNRRYIGGQDRRAVLDHVYAVLRCRAELGWRLDRARGDVALPQVERARMIARMALIEGWSADRIAGAFDGGQYRPSTLDQTEKRIAKALEGQPLADPRAPLWVKLEFPEWCEPRLKRAFGRRLEAEMKAALDEAATDIRVNTLKTTREAAIKALRHAEIEAKPTPLSPWGLRVEGRPPLAGLEIFRNGIIEIQDEGSQLVALMVDARPGERVVDFCAGAGGKTLAIAATMQNKGKIVATDVLKGRIERSATRIRRAGVNNVERRDLSSERDPWVKRHQGGFDRVLIDAPCSGAGTWRRNPDAKWRLKPADLDNLVDLQRRILESAARLVKPGGRLVYATCSLFQEENADQVKAFLDAHPDFGLVPAPKVWAEAMQHQGADVRYPGDGDMLVLTPARHGTDGFFVAVMEKKP